MEFIRTVQIWAKMIKLEHTVFSAPFMLVAMFFAAAGNVPDPKVLFWAAIGLLGARSAAMTLNRIIDSHIDANNPRTVNRAIPKGLISNKEALFFSIAGFVLLLLAALNLPFLCVILFPVAVIGLTLYSYTKRFTWLCHLYLGIAIAGAIIGGWIAVTGTLNSLLPIFLSFGVCFWICGFDILYAIDDYSFDQKFGIYSIPARFGINNALLISRFCHLISFVAFAYCYWLMPVDLGFYYILGLVILGIGLIYEQWIVYKDLNNIEKAFFQANAWISIAFCLIIIGGKLLLG